MELPYSGINSIKLLFYKKSALSTRLNNKILRFGQVYDESIEPNSGIISQKSGIEPALD